MIDEESLRGYARLAGFLYLFVIVAYDAGDYFAVSPQIVSGNFARTAQNVTATETLYRVGLASEFVASWMTIPLAGALYCLLKGVNANVALFALLFDVADWEVCAR